MFKLFRLYSDGHHGGGYSYPPVDPRLEEVLDNGTTVQSTGAERSLAQTHDMISNPPCSQHMSGGAKNKAVTNIGDKKAETGSGDFIRNDSYQGEGGRGRAGQGRG